MEPSSIEPFLGPVLSVFNPITFGLGIAFVVMALLLFCSAMISGSEVAFFSLSPSEIDELKRSKNKSDQRILRHIDQPKDLLATILITNNFVNVAIVIVSTYILENWINFTGMAEWKIITIKIVLVTFVILLIGEVIPKVYANNNAVRLAKRMSLPLTLLKRIFYPLSWLLVSGTSFIDKRIKKKGTEISVDDLQHALDITDKSERSEDEQKILEGIIKFGNTDVKQIMKPRMDVVSIEINTPFSALKPQLIEKGYSRIPVFKESFDQIKGVLYVKDLIPHLHEKKLDWVQLIRAPFFVPENKKIDDLLKEFQDSKVHIAIVVDEYGGSSGIVTLEDIIEEIIGDISDEFDDDHVVYSKIDEHNYVFEGKTPLIDLYRVLDIDGAEFEANKGESDTIAGFLIEQAGKILMKNEKVHFGNYTFIIEASDRRRIKQVKINIKTEAHAEES